MYNMYLVSKLTDIPIEVVDLVVKYIFDKKSCICDNNKKYRDYLSFILTNTAFYKNFKMTIPCLSSKKICFENKKWCYFHNKDEYLISANVIKELNNKNKASQYKFLDEDENKYFCHPFNNNFDISKSPKIFAKKIRTVCPSNKYKINWFCCDGKGFCFSLR